jgi:predicted transcriptional regulator
MTKDQIAAVLDRVRSWPAARQEDAARVLLAMEAEDASPYLLDAEERAEIEAALGEAARGEFATEAEVEAVFARYRT